MTSAVELDERISKCRKILDADPNSQIFAALADSFRKKGDLGQAFQVCQQGLRVHGSYGPAHLVMAKINLDRGLYDWAETEAQKAASLDGWTRGIEMLLAEINIYQGHFEEAIKLLSRLHQNDPDNKQITKLLEIARRLPEDQANMIGSSSKVAAEATLITSSAPESKPLPPQPIEPSPLDASELVAKAVEIPDVEGAVFVNFDGLLAESSWQSEIDATVMGASLSEVVSELNVHLFENGFGALGTVLIETEGPIFMIARVDDGQFMFVTVTDANLGTVKMKVEKLLMTYSS